MTPRDTEDAFSVGTWQVYPKENRLVDGDGVMSLEPRVMSLFVCLADAPGKIISSNELLGLVWHGRAHGDHTVYQAIADLRKALGDDATRPRYIETIPKRGYRLIAEVSAVNAGKMSGGLAAFSQLGHRFAFLAAGTVLAAAVAFLAANGQFRIWLSQASAGSQSIAVLPFVNLSDDPDNDFFSDGLSEDILIFLADVPQLKVIGRTSSFAFKGQSEDPVAIGETLGVETVLGGSIRKLDDRIRITAKLIDVSDGALIWSESYDRTVTNIIEVQKDVATAIFDALKIRAGTIPSRERPTENWRAYTHYLEARGSMHTDRRRAEGLLLQATELDPSFAEAWELLAFLYYRMAGSIIEAAKGQKLAGEAAARALAIDPDLVIARAMFEAADTESWSLAGEIAAFARALRERPNSLALMHALQFDLFYAGYLQEALEIRERIADLDPFSQPAINQLATSLYAVERTDEAIALLESQARLGVNQARWDLGEIHLVAGQDDIAFSYFEAHETHNGYPDPAWVREWVARARDPESGQDFLDRSIEKDIALLPNEEAYAWRLGSAEWYLYFGYLDRYFELVSAAGLTASTWTDAEWLIQAGMLYRRQGFSAHPKYLEVAEATGIVDVWEQRGPPDFCDKIDDAWVCH